MMSTEGTIALDELKDGDIVLYELKEIPSFIKPFSKENLEDNFSILIDKLICFAEDSKVTHAALVYDKNKVVEAVIPAVRVCDRITDPHSILHIRRVASDIDATTVLEYLPQTPQEIEENPQSYAMMMAAVAGLSCLLKKKIEKKDSIAALSAIVRCVLYKVAQYLDAKKIPYANGTENWFCSQLVYFTYTRAAVELHQPAFEIVLKNPSTPVTDTLIHHLITNADVCKINPSKTMLTEPVECTQLFEIADAFFTSELNSDTDGILSAVRKPEADDFTFIMSCLEKITGIDVDSDDIEKALIKFQSAFVMPSDLCDCLAEGYRVADDDR